MHDCRNHNRDPRGNLGAAAITGLFAGVARAVTDWLLRHLPFDW